MDDFESLEGELEIEPFSRNAATVGEDEVIDLSRRGQAAIAAAQAEQTAGSVVVVSVGRLDPRP